MKNEKQKESQNKMKIKMEKTGCKSTEAGSCAAKKTELIIIMTKSNNINSMEPLPTNSEYSCECDCECEHGLHFCVCFSGLQVNANNICASYFVLCVFCLWSAARRRRWSLCRSGTQGPTISLVVQCPTCSTVRVRSLVRSLRFDGRKFN